MTKAASLYTDFMFEVMHHEMVDGFERSMFSPAGNDAPDLSYVFLNCLLNCAM